MIKVKQILMFALLVLKLKINLKKLATLVILVVYKQRNSSYPDQEKLKCNKQN